MQPAQPSHGMCKKLESECQKPSFNKILLPTGNKMEVIDLVLSLQNYIRLGKIDSPDLVEEKPEVDQDPDQVSVPNIETGARPSTTAPEPTSPSAAQAGSCNVNPRLSH